MKANVGAEMAVLGSLIDQAPQLIPEVLSIAHPRMFYRPAHEDIAATLADMHAKGDKIDPQTVLTRLTTRGIAAKLDGGAVYLHTLIQRAWTPLHAPDHAREIRACWQHRQALELVERLEQLLDTEDPQIAAALGLAIAEMDGLLELGVTDDPVIVPTLGDILGREATHDWVVQGLLERGDRMMLTGIEGGGKSMLLRQLAVCFAQGLHPFEKYPIDPVRVLLIDAENSQRQNTRKYLQVFRAVEQLAASRALDPELAKRNLAVVERPGGFDMTDADERVWLTRYMDAHRPDVLIIGPLYLLHSLDVNEDLSARRVVQVLDQLRTRYGCAVVTEAHAGHGQASARGQRNMRPIGSSLFMRWVEFGYGLRPSEHDDPTKEHPTIMDLVSWKPSRDEREWPEAVRYGDGLNPMPWVPF